MGTSGAYGGSPAGRMSVIRRRSGSTPVRAAEAAAMARRHPRASRSPRAAPSGPAGTPSATGAGKDHLCARRALTGGGGGGGGGGGLTGGGGRSAARASTVGGRALGGAYGARTGTAATLGELGLDLEELVGLSRYQQAQRILDAAIGPRGDVLDSELRKTNASVVLWALTEEVEPTPVELANRWVVEYVWEVWITESGPTLQEHSADGSDRVRLEQEMRAALEATVSAHALPEGRALTTADFTAAIDGALASLRRISGSAA